MSTVYLTQEEQKLITEVKYVNNPRDGDIEAKKLLEILKRNEPGSRVTFLNYYVGKASAGKPAGCLIKSDPFNKDIVENLSQKAASMHKNTITNSGTTGFDILAKGHQNGMFTTPLLNIGTTDAPVWDIFPNIIITVSTGGFSVRNVYNSPEPRRVVTNVKNTNKFEQIYKPFLSPGSESLDNTAYCEIVKIVQDELRDCLEYIRELYTEQGGKSKIHLRSDTGIASSIFESERLNESSPAALYKTVKSNAKKIGGVVEFEKIPCENPEDHYTQLRINISPQTDNAFWQDYCKGTKHGFSEKNIRVVAPKNQVHYRYVNTKLLGKNTKSILNMHVILSLKHSEKFGPPPQENSYSVYAYRYIDKKLVGEDHKAMFEFAECNNQVLNTVVNLKIFVGPHELTPSFDIVTARPIFITRLNSENFKRSSEVTYEELDDISYVTGELKSAQAAPTPPPVPILTTTAISEDVQDEDLDIEETDAVPRRRVVRGGD